MNLYSMQFVAFFLIAFVLYYTLLRKWQWMVLLTASLVFYLYSGPVNLIFLITTAFSTWLGGKGIFYCTQQFKIRKKEISDRKERQLLKGKYTRKKRCILWLVLLLNFGILAVLKYWNPQSKSILIPLGISFYTFISMGYLIDLYYEKYAAEKNFLRFLLFISYFPQLIQGPINRFDQMREQFLQRHILDLENAARAVLLLGFGVMKKYAIANALSGVIADILDKSLADAPGSAIVFAILLYSIQQYCDFSGGIDMVLGISELFGIRMMPNFRQPYFATSLGDFWRRWHISLGAWMRDYVFYPFALTKPMQNLGKWAKNHMGKHFGKVLPAAVANLLVFFLVGIWHGSQWHYIFWGLYNGAVIALGDICAPAFEKLAKRLHISTESKGFYVFSVIKTFIIVNIGWYFDRIYSMRNCAAAMKNTLLNFSPERFVPYLKEAVSGFHMESIMIMAAALILVIIRSVLAERGVDVYAAIRKRPAVLRWGLYYVMIGLVLASFMFTKDTGGFMYANF